MPTTHSKGSKEQLSGLVVEAEGPQDSSDQLTNEIRRSLKETQQRAVQVLGSNDGSLKSWEYAGELVAEFKPVPWFIWRITNFVFSRTGQINQITEGHVLGLRRLIFAAASDQVLGAGKKISDVRRALEILSSDVVAAVSVIHAVSRRLATKTELQRVWRPILEDAILRAEIGYYVGAKRPPFGSGRGMLAGFAGRIGLAILIAQGDQDQARSALERLAIGEEVSKVAIEVYECDALQVSAMTLSACGCGRDAAFGTVSYATPNGDQLVDNEEQRYWHAAFSIAEALRVGRSDDIQEATWEILGFYEERQRASIVELTNDILRRGSGWPWLIQI